MARWIPTKRQKYGVGECLPRPTPTRAPPSPRALAPPSWRTLRRPGSLVLQPRESSPPGLLKVLLGLGTLVPYPNTNSSVAHCGSASGPLCHSESSGADTSADEEERLPGALMPTVPGSPLKNDLRWKYLTQVDILLQDEEYFKNAEKRNGKDTLMTFVSSSRVTPPPGCQDGISEKSFGSPQVSASSSRDWSTSNPCQADMTIMPRNDSFSFLGTSSSSLSSQPLEVDNICDVTVSDMYEGMMYSMSRLLSLKPSCIISTKTYINQNWNPRRRLSQKSRVHMNRTYSHRSKPFQRSSKKGPSSKPGKEVLRDCKNLLHTAPKTDLKLERGSLEGSKLQVYKFNPAWKELQVMPQKYLDLNTANYHEQENRVKTLQWLISPVKIVPRPGMLPSQAEKWYKEIEMKFDKLHQECSLSSEKQLPLAGPTESWAVDVYRGTSRSPGSPQGIKTHRLSSPFNRGKKRSSEAFEDISEMSVKADSCLPSGHPTLLPLGGNTSAGLFLQRHNFGPIRKAVSPSTANSVPWTSPWGHGRNRYDEIKEEFDKLYQKYCLMSPPQQVKMTSCVTVSSKKAGAAVPSQTEDLRKLNPDSGFQSSPKLSASGWNIRKPQDSIPVEAQMSARTAGAVMRDPRFPTKRRKLSYPPTCAH
ncbi:Holliday junction recognition protein [Cricetulus griseus]